MKKDVVINQFFGLGDILFIEPIYRHFHNQGHKVIAPVNPESLWVQKYIPYVQFEDKNSFPYSYETVEQPEDGRIHIPLRFAHPLLRGYDLHYGDDRKNWMGDKYEYLGLDRELWRTMSFSRDMEAENKLAWIVGATGEYEYNFINQHYGGNFSKVNISPSNGLKNIYLEKIGNYTLLDWLLVIERATNIYSVETSVVWPIEAMKMEARELHMYPRLPWLENVDYMKPYLKKNWILHDTTNI